MAVTIMIYDSYDDDENSNSIQCVCVYLTVASGFTRTTMCFLLDYPKCLRISWSHFSAQGQQPAVPIASRHIEGIQEAHCEVGLPTQGIHPDPGCPAGIPQWHPLATGHTPLML